MKTISLLIAAVSISVSSCAQDIPTSKVPSVVQNTVQAKFANATNTEWEKKNNFYEAEFKINKIEYTVYIDSTGKLVKHKMDMEVKDLPSAIIAAIGRDHAGYEIDEAEKLEKDGVIYYQVELEKKGEKDKELVFSSTGAIAAGIIYMK